MMKLETVVAVERERERAYSLKNKVLFLFNTLTHTSKFIKNKKGEKAFFNGGIKGRLL